MERQTSAKKRAVIQPEKLLNGIVHGETVQFIEQRRAELHKNSSSRINTILGPNFGDEKTKKPKLHFMAQKVLKLHGFPEREILGMSLTDTHRLATRLVASDLLVTELYDPNGKLSNFAERNYRNIDAEDYVVLPGKWQQIKILLERQLKSAGWRDPDINFNEYVGAMGVDVDNNVDIAFEYARFFGEKSIVALPFNLNVDKNYIAINYEDDFMEPYGGSSFASRLIFVPREGIFLG
ncbi:MAG: hypothetical protein HYV90_01505 [Candidatus Woesebacteria bacterium]|nr:MAG: hypothetical protein HYV90_01505 [Candidatus Woesebacteria bacterium]